MLHVGPHIKYYAIRFFNITTNLMCNRVIALHFWAHTHESTSKDDTLTLTRGPSPISIELQGAVTTMLNAPSKLI